jgi:hypothetical protein
MNVETSSSSSKESSSEEEEVEDLYGRKKDGQEDIEMAGSTKSFEVTHEDSHKMKSLGIMNLKKDEE